MPCFVLAGGIWFEQTGQGSTHTVLPILLKCTSLYGALHVRSYGCMLLTTARLHFLTPHEKEKKCHLRAVSTMHCAHTHVNASCPGLCSSDPRGTLHVRAHEHMLLTFPRLHLLTLIKSENKYNLGAVTTKPTPFPHPVAAVPPYLGTCVLRLLWVSLCDACYSPNLTQPSL